MKILIQRDSYDKFLLVKPKTLILYLRNNPFLTFVGEGLYVLKVILLKEINDEVLILQSVIYLIMTDKQQQLK